ncbi:MAG: hypothetical protein AAGA48_16735 [Myxococcota bacterium]
MSVVGTVVNQWLERADQRLLSAWYQATSIRVDRLRDALRERRAPFIDPQRSSKAPPHALVDIDRTANEVLAEAAENAGMRAGIAGLVGVATLPTEVVTTTIAALRLGQRLCVVYGFDPNTDRGRMALCQALAAGFDVDLPPTGPVGFKVSEIAAIVRGSTPPPSISARLTRAMATHTALWAASRPGRWLPLVGARRQATVARERTEATGARMVAVLRRLSEAPGSTRDHLEEAQEIRST